MHIPKKLYCLKTFSGHIPEIDSLYTGYAINWNLKEGVIFTFSRWTNISDFEYTSSTLGIDSMIIDRPILEILLDKGYLLELNFPKRFIFKESVPNLDGGYSAFRKGSVFIFSGTRSRNINENILHFEDKVKERSIFLNKERIFSWIKRGYIIPF
jgi:hypothetical protein